MSHALVAVRRGRRNVALPRLRRPIREKPNIWLPFAVLVTNPGEKRGLEPAPADFGPSYPRADSRWSSRHVVIARDVRTATG